MAYAGKLPIGTLILMFLAYIGLHVAIGIQKKRMDDASLKLNNQLKGGIDPVSDEQLNEADKQVKVWGLLFKFFPMAYLIFVMIYFFMQ